MSMHEDINSGGMVKNVVVYFVPRDMLFRFSLTEGKLKEIGCAYSSNDRGKIDEIIHIVNGAKLEFIAKIPASWEAREAIYLGLNSGDEIRIIFDRDFSNSKFIYGEYFSKNNPAGVFIQINHLFIEDIYRWAATVDALPGKAESNKKMCGDYVSEP